MPPQGLWRIIYFYEEKILDRKICIWGMKGIFFVGEIRREEFEDFPYEWREKRKSPLIWRLKEIPPEILRGGGGNRKARKEKKISRIRFHVKKIPRKKSWGVEKKSFSVGSRRKRRYFIAPIFPEILVKSLPPGICRFPKVSQRKIKALNLPSCSLKLPLSRPITIGPKSKNRSCE